MTKETAQQLANAIQKADLPLLQSLINSGIDLNQKIGHGLPPLALACYYLNIEITKMLLTAGADVNTTYDKNKTALTQTCEAYQQPEEQVLSIVQLLLDHGAEVNLVKGNNDGALQYAAMFGYPEIVNLLLKTGAEVNKKGGYGRTALIYAATASHGDSLQSLKYLLEAGADINATNDPKENALFEHLTRHDNPAVAEFLIDNGIDLKATNQSGDFALHWAAFCGRPNIVNLLLDRGFDIDSKNQKGNTPIERAMSFQKMEVVKLLVERGANLDKKANFFSISVLRFAASHDETDLVLKILKKQNNNKSQGALAEAAGKGNLALVREIVEVGVAVDDRELESHNTPLISAAYYGKIEVVRFLLQHGADVNLYDYKKDTALLNAAWCKHTQIVELLLNAGADINQRNAFNWNALIQTCVQNDYNTCKLLLEKGSPTDEIDAEYGVTALSIAIDSKADKVVELLKSYGAKERFIHKRKKDEALYAISDCDICKYLTDEKDLRQTKHITPFPDLITLFQKEHTPHEWESSTKRVLKCPNCATVYYNYHEYYIDDNYYRSNDNIVNRWQRINLLRLPVLLEELKLDAELKIAKSHYPTIIENFKKTIQDSESINLYHFDYIIETLLDYFVQNQDFKNLDKYLFHNTNPTVVFCAIDGFMQMEGGRFSKWNLPSFAGQPHKFDISNVEPFLKKHAKAVKAYLERYKDSADK